MSVDRAWKIAEKYEKFDHRTGQKLIAATLFLFTIVVFPHWFILWIGPTVWAFYELGSYNYWYIQFCKLQRLVDWKFDDVEKLCFAKQMYGYYEGYAAFYECEMGHLHQDCPLCGAK